MLYFLALIGGGFLIVLIVAIYIFKDEWEDKTWENK